MITHLYLKPSSTPGNTPIVISIFDDSGGHTYQRTTAETTPEALAELIDTHTPAAIYNCAASGYTQPPTLAIPWIDLAAGHPTERL
jgi:hypothetical protein